MRKIQSSLLPKLVNIGLTPQEANIYLLVLYNPLLKVRDVAKQLGLLGPSIHRSLRPLKLKGLIRTIGKRPIKLRAVDPSIALPQLINKQYQNQTHIQEKIEQELRATPVFKDELKVEYLEGKEEIFDHAIPIIKQTQKEILILSIGENIPSDVFISITEAAKRGVKVKMIAEKFNKNNRALLKNWQKNRWNIRYLRKINLDFTLVIYDSKLCVVQVRKEEQKDIRIGIAFYNPAYTKTQRNYFNEMWKKAISV